MLSVANPFKLSFVMLNIILLNVILLYVILLNVIMLSVVMPNVVALFWHNCVHLFRIISTSDFVLHFRTLTT